MSVIFYFCCYSVRKVAELFVGINRSLVLQDGQIDYGEFAAMMRKGNGGIGRRTMRSTLNFRDALGLIGNGSNQDSDGHL